MNNRAITRQIDEAFERASLLKSLLKAADPDDLKFNHSQTEGLISIFSETVDALEMAAQFIRDNVDLDVQFDESDHSKVVSIKQ